MTSAAERVRAGLRQAIVDRRFPAAVAEVGDGRGVLWREAFGSLTFDVPHTAADESTVFDLASLTKPVATTTLVMRLVADGQLELGSSIRLYFDEWRAADRQGVTVRDLLEHASGLPARLLDAAPSSRREFEHEICTMPLEYRPRDRSLYSDLGFILLGFLLADRGGEDLACQFQRVAHEITDDILAFNPQDLRRRIAPTIPERDDVRSGRRLVGEVHDSYAAVLGGAAGHAGLFGTAKGVGDFARVVLRAASGEPTPLAGLAPAMVALAMTKSTVPGSSRALGWDTMLSTSSCGTRMSPAAFGHVGYTGTSLWIDPAVDRYFVLLTNRVCEGGTLEEIRLVRRSFHDLARDI